MAEVLVVDDDADIRALVTFALEDAGYDVRQAADGAAALSELAARAPDAMVVDVMMPRLDGFAVVRAMHAQRLAPATRVLILTCKTEERDHARGWDCGADDYLTKPFDPDELVARVQWLLGAAAADLAQRRRREREKAELLARLEATFNRRLAVDGR